MLLSLPTSIFVSALCAVIVHGEAATKTETFSIVTASNSPPKASSPSIDNGKEFIQYSTVKGFFLQDETSTNATSFDYTKENFGLINRNYPTDPKDKKGFTQWQLFDRFFKSLNDKAPSNTQYKLIFLGRHGEGFHNAAQDFYGTNSWNCFDAEFRGNETVIWADAHLTPDGVEEALAAHKFWEHELRVQKIHPPMSYYTSPLTRCLQTASFTYNGLDLPKKFPFVPLVKELFREGVSIHRCDRRHSRAHIRNKFPTYRIEDTLTEFDEIWNGITSETPSAQDYRSKVVLDEVFSSEPASIISITSHSGEGASLLRVLKHIEFPLNTGEIIPVLVKAETKKSSAEAESTSTQPWTTSAWCTNGPPKASQTTGALACICSHGVVPTATTTGGLVKST